jgi:hypothetical protein
MNDYYKIETVSDLKKHVDFFHENICCDGKTTGPHNYPSRVRFYNRTTKQYMELVNIEADRHSGCGCWVGMELEFVNHIDDEI